VNALEGKAALVTGAAGGIGHAVVRTFEEAGASVFGVDVAQADGVFQADLARADEARAAVETAVSQLGRLDVVFNGAGISGRPLGDGPVHDCTEEAWDRVLDANLKSVFLVCRATVPHLLAAGGGSIVNVASVLGLVGGDQDFGTHAYAASKGGVVALSRGIAVYYAPQGIRCNILCPAVIDTPQGQRSVGDPRIRGRLRELQPLTGEPGRPEDVSAAALYLASDASRFVTGVALPVDGGWTAR
jgi:meso-butanediol dehydrogenase / (S,S)-butanediol dehydrogenase / diacetyl reductase